MKKQDVIDIINEKQDIIDIINEYPYNKLDISILSHLILRKKFEKEHANEEMVTLYRNIGRKELEKLLSGQVIVGYYNLSHERQSSAHYDRVVCTYKDKIIWKFSNSDSHQYIIKLSVPKSACLKTGIGTYFASKQFKTTKVWTGRRGSVQYELEEVYLDSYDISNLVEIQETNLKVTDYDLELTAFKLGIPFKLMLK